jgi:hypothetical protein
VRGKSAQCRAYNKAFVKRSASHSIEDIAKRVVNEVEIQINILGRGSDIQRAIRMYGRIGGNIDDQKTKTGFVVDPAHPSTMRSMVSLFMEDMVGTTDAILEDVFLLPPSAIRRSFNFINTHKILLVVLALSVFLNLFLSGRSTVEYWQYRSAERLMKKAGVTANNAIIRMVSLKDIDDLVKAGLTGANSTYSGLW